MSAIEIVKDLAGGMVGALLGGLLGIWLSRKFSKGQKQEKQQNLILILAVIVPLIIGQTLGPIVMDALFPRMNSTHDVRKALSQDPLLSFLMENFPEEMDDTIVGMTQAINDHDADKARFIGVSSTTSLRIKYADEALKAPVETLNAAIGVYADALQQMIDDEQILTCNAFIESGAAAFKDAEVDYEKERRELALSLFRALSEGRQTPVQRDTPSQQDRENFVQHWQTLELPELTQIVLKYNPENPRNCEAFQSYFSAISAYSAENGDSLKADVVRGIARGY